MSMSKALAKAIEARDKADDDITRILVQDYPVGDPITWDRNGIHTGVVVMHSSMGQQIKVKSSKSGKEYWIYCDGIVS